MTCGAQYRGDGVGGEGWDQHMTCGAQYRGDGGGG